MSKKFVWMSALLVVVLVSGYAYYNSNGTVNPPAKPELIPQTGLPSGFTYMGTHETPVEIGGSRINATEGVYRYGGEDVYIQVIENSNPEALIDQYKLKYKSVKYSPFKEISFNGHTATQVTDYTTVNGQQKPNYAVIWATDKAMIIVGSPTAGADTVIVLAAATGS